MSYVVTAPAVAVSLADGNVGYVYFGDVVPNTATSTELERLSAIGLIKAVELDFPAYVEVDLPAATPVGIVAKPRRVAPKEEWLAYALAQGADPAVVEVSTKDELVALYGA